MEIESDSELLVEALATDWPTPSADEEDESSYENTDPPGTWRGDTEDRDA